ncbi:MAG: class II aldolase/adducin family protein, partial [Euryarchaeota archaeon]|nr:class II aldolase/adducin family protein [Euryarchaeota archaeon]
MENEIVRYMRLLYDRGLTSSLSGNASTRLNDMVYISPTHIPCYRINEDNVSVVTIKGRHVAGKPPSSELPTHLA